MNRLIQWLCPRIVNNMARSVSNSKRITTIEELGTDVVTDLHTLSDRISRGNKLYDKNFDQADKRLIKLNNWTTDMQARLSNLSTASNDRHNLAIDELRRAEERLNNKIDRLDQLVIALIAGEKLGSVPDNQ
tara:strand:+ start:3980 stop:4375 length:396 start_codon:yes stop_codon:yes gene_type:complete